MTFWQIFTLLLSLTPISVSAISRIDIQVGEINSPSVQIQKLTASMTLDGHWHGKAFLKQTDLPSLTSEFHLPVAISKGTIDGHAEFSGNAMNPESFSANLNLTNIAFADNSGLHAGEKISGLIHIDLQKDTSSALSRWQWQTSLNWQDGEVFWQPLYLSAGHALKAQGIWSPTQLRLENGNLRLKDIGTVSFQGDLNLPDKSIINLSVSAHDLLAGKSYELLAQPFFEKSMLGNLEVAGRLDLDATIHERQLQAFTLNLNGMDIEDKSGRFALYKVNASMPWALNEPTRANVRFEGGRLLRMTLGKADLYAKLEGWSLATQEWNIPVLDGVLSLQDVSAALRDGQWHGHFAAKLSPISMSEFSHAAGWPHMEGKLAASIPLVTYSSGILAMDGAMQFDVFDGHVKVSRLALNEVLGLAPRLKADIEMRNLDLGLLTSTFSFGDMKGRLDGDVAGIELSSWKPVRFDASFRSSPGNYPRKISQRAVENISALGGAGAAAAIQRSFLRFLNEFNYAKIGLSCKLRNGVCAMDGVEPSQSGYIIVKGSGIPAITVQGYNRNVSWTELLERLQRITAGNAKPVIK